MPIHVLKLIDAAGDVQRTALSFDGTDDNVALDKSFATTALGPVTLECVLRTTVTSTTTLKAVSWDEDHYFSLGVNSTGGAEAKLFLSTGGTQTISGGDVSDGRWHHVAMTWDNTDLKLFVDGAAVAQSTGLSNKAGSGTTRFGVVGDESASSVFNGSVGGAGGPFGGDVDEVRLWNTARTSDQLDDKKDLLLDPTSTESANLTYYWRFDEGSSVSVENITSATDGDGTINGATWITPPAVALAPFPTTETVEEKATKWGSSSPQDLIDRGFTFVAQPVPVTAEFEEVYDTGTVVENSRVVAALDRTNVTTVSGGTINFTISAKAGTSSTAWTDTTGSDVFHQDFRYVKTRLDFASDGTTTTTAGTSGAAQFWQLNELDTTLRVKLKTDQGTVNLSVNPTTVTFNESFVDITAIVLTPQSTVARFAVLDFDDVPNPTSFRVHLLTSTGGNTTGRVHWQARGN